MREWPERGPELVWRFGNLRPSWASVVVASDTVYVPGGGSVGKLFAFTLDTLHRLAKDKKEEVAAAASKALRELERD